MCVCVVVERELFSLHKLANKTNNTFSCCTSSCYQPQFIHPFSHRKATDYYNTWPAAVLQLYMDACSIMLDVSSHIYKVEKP